jgi:hypothetical protein
MMHVTYLRHSLAPAARQVLAARPGPIHALAPTDWPHPFVCFLDGLPVLRADWHRVVESGHHLAFVDVTALPQGGGGGGSNALRLVAFIAVMVYAPYLAPALGVTGVAATAVTMAATAVGMAVVNAVLPAPKPPSPQQAASMAAASPTYSLQAQGNTARLEAAIPEHFGRLRAYPDFAAMPYAEFAGNEQYLYQLLCIGTGYYDVEAIQIEDTPISSYDNVTYELVQPGGTLTLFPANVVTSSEVSGQELLKDNTLGPFVLNDSGTLANTVGIDVILPSGLYYVNDDGSLSAKSVTFLVESRPIDAVGSPTGAWATLYNNTISAANNTPQRYSWRFAVTPGRYQVRMSRLDDKDTSSRAGHTAVWAGLRAYMQDVRQYGDVTLLAVRMQASNSLSQQASRKINVIATRKLPVWTGTGWTAPQPTRSIAWAFAYMCKSVGLTDTQIDLAALLVLQSTWQARGDTFDARYDQFMSFWEAVTKAGIAGRSKPLMQGGIMRLVRDQAATIPVAMFTTRSIVRGSFGLRFMLPSDDTADAIKATYFDETAWAPSTVTAKLPDSTAAKPAKIDLFGITNRAQAYREAMYQAASNRYRREIITFTTEAEGRIVSFLDLIAVQHDMPGWGQGGEVKAWDAATRTLTLTEPLTWQAGANHYIALRTRKGAVSGPWLCTAGAAATQVVLASVPDITPYTGTAAERTHYSFGWADTVVQYARVISVRPDSRYRVKIEAVVESANVHTADQGIVTPERQTSQLANFANAPALVGLTVVATPNDRRTITAAWQSSPWAVGYVVEQSTDGTVWVRVGETTNTSLQFAALKEGVSYVRVAAINLARGAWAQATYSMPSLPSVTGLAVNPNQNGLLITWDKCADLAYQHTELRLGTSWESATLITKKTSTSHLLDWQAAGTVTLWARHTDTAGSSSSTASTASLQVLPPANVVIRRNDIQVNTVALGWDNAKTTQPLKGYSIYTGAATAEFVDCTLYGAAGADSRSDVVIFRSAGAKRIYLVAEDVAGNLSTPQSIDVTVTLPTNFVLSSEWDADWSGTKTNAVVYGTGLLLPVPVETWGEHFANRGWASAADQVAAGYPVYYQPSTNSGSYQEVHDIGKIIPSAKITTTVTSTTLAGSLVPTVQIDWSDTGTTWVAGVAGATDVQATEVRYVRVTYSVTASGGDDLVQLLRVNTTVSAEEMTEFGEIVLSAADAAGTVYVCAKPFRDVKTVNFSPKSEIGGTTTIARWNTIIDDATSPAKVYVQAWDINDNRTSGPGSLIVGGY